MRALAADWERAFPGTDGSAVHFFAWLDHLRDRMNRFYDDALSPHGLVYSEFRVLSVLRLQAEGQGLTPVALHRFAGLTSAGMTRTLARLEKAGHTTRRPNPDDGRSVVIELTPKGWKFAETVCRCLSDAYEELVETLPKDLDPQLRQVRRLVLRLDPEMARS